MSLRVARRIRSDAPLESSLSESKGKGLSVHQVIHAVDQSRVANRPLAPTRNRMLSSTGGLGKDIPIEPNQLKRRFAGNQSPYVRRGQIKRGMLNLTHRLGLQ